MLAKKGGVGTGLIKKHMYQPKFYILVHVSQQSSPKLSVAFLLLFSWGVNEQEEGQKQLQEDC